MRRLILALAIAVVGVIGLFLLLAAGSIASLTVQALTSTSGHEPYIKFGGPVESRPVSPTVAGDWRIGGITVTVSLTTTMDDEHGPPVLGAWVEVEGWAQADGSVLATEIETERGPHDEADEFEFKGIIEELPATLGYTGTWQVSGIRFTVDLSTTIEGTPAISDVAEVEALRAADGTLIAKEIQVKDDEDDENEREWKGFIEKLGSGPSPRYEGEWVVGGISVTVGASTELEYTGGFALEDWVEVEAYLQPDGSLLAHEIEIEDRDSHDHKKDSEVEFRGVIQHITPFTGTWPITWKVSHLTVWLTATTIVDESKGPAVVGDWAEVKADDVSGQLWAREIEIEQEGEGDDDDGDPDNEFEIEGLVSSLNPLIIGGQEIVTDTDTVIKGTPALSVTAEAKGRWVPTPGLHFLASRIKFGDEDDDGDSHYEIEGTIASLPADPSFNGTWVVTTAVGMTRSFEVTTSTEREFEDGDPAVGCWSEAETNLQDGVQVASEVEVEHCGPGDDDGYPDDGEYLRLEGIISVLGSGPAPRNEGEWVVGGITFTVVPTTFIDMSEGTPALGRKAQVKATGSDGQWLAFRIEIKGFEDDDGPTLQSRLRVAAISPGADAVNVSGTSGHSRVPNLVIRASGDHHLVWEESDGRIYHSWKVKGGQWSLPMPVGTGSRPDLKEAAGILYVAWSDDDGSGNHEIYLARWDDTGSRWDAPKNVSHTSGQSISPDVSADGGGILHFAWADNTPGDWVIYHGTLSANAPVPSAQGQAPRMSVADDGTVHLTWQDRDLNGQLQVYYSRLDVGKWDLPQDISHSAPAASTVPNMALDDTGNPHLVWEELPNGSVKDIYYASWRQGTWSTPTALANTVADSFLPSTSFGGGVLHVAWTESATSSTDPRVLYRKLEGEAWSPLQTILSNGTRLSKVCLAADANAKIHIAWANYTSSGLVNPRWDWDIYYGASHLLFNKTYLPLVAR